MDEMRATEIVRLIEWLSSKGFTSEEILECLKYLSK